MQIYDTLLFDLDGTLADTLQDLGDCTNQVLTAHGFPSHPLDAYRHFVGDGARKLIERALGEAAAPDLTDRLLDEFRLLYDRECLRSVAPYPGILQAVAKLKDRGVKMAVVTNKPEPQAKRIAAHLFPAGTFGAVHGNVPGLPAKPDPAVVMLTLRELDSDPSRTLFAGDSDVDVFTAHRSGMPCIGCCWGFRGEEELTAAGAELLAHRAEDIPALFFGL